MVVDLRVSWPSSGSLDFRLKTENIPKMKLRLDWSTKMMMLLLTTVNRSLTLMATLRLEVLGLSSRSPLINGISAALLEVSLTFATTKFYCLLQWISRVQAPQLGWHLSGVGSTLANSDFVDNIVSDLIEVLSRQASLW